MTVAPCLEVKLPVPMPVAKALEPLLWAVARGARPSDAERALRLPHDVLAYLDALTAFVFRGHLWVSDGRTLEAWRLSDGVKFAGFPLPSIGEIAPGAGMWRRARLEPFGPLDRLRLLFLVVGYRHHVLGCVPAVLDVRTLLLQPIEVRDEGGLRPFGTTRRTGDPDVFLYVEEADAGAACHVDDYSPVELPHVLDLRAATLGFTNRPPRSTPCPAGLPLNRARTLHRPGSMVHWTPDDEGLTGQVHREDWNVMEGFALRLVPPRPFANVCPGRRRARAAVLRAGVAPLQDVQTAS
jgi:hypothetical protein